MKKELERCGFCGRFCKGEEYVDEVSDEVPLGYCPNAKQEDYEQNPEHYMHQLTRDMAIDAGDPSLEGTWI